MGEIGHGQTQQPVGHRLTKKTQKVTEQPRRYRAALYRALPGLNLRELT